MSIPPMAGGIKYNIGLKKLRKFSGKKTRHRGFIAFDKAQKILVAWDEYQLNESSDKKAIDSFISFLEKSGKSVTRAIYFHKRKKENIPVPVESDTLHFSKNDFNLVGLPKTPEIKKLTAEPFDYFINLNLDGRLPLKSIAGFTQASCRIGYNRAKAIEFYDLILGNPDKPDMKKFVEDLEYYLLKIG